MFKYICRSSMYDSMDSIERAYTEELWRMIKEANPDPDERRVFIECVNEARAREIGRALDARGGFASLARVSDELARRQYDAPETYGEYCDLRELDFCWSGIGQWMA